MHLHPLQNPLENPLEWPPQQEGQDLPSIMVDLPKPPGAHVRAVIDMRDLTNHQDCRLVIFGTNILGDAMTIDLPDHPLPVPPVLPLPVLSVEETDIDLATELLSGMTAEIDDALDHHTPGREDIVVLAQGAVTTTAIRIFLYHGEPLGRCQMFRSLSWMMLTGKNDCYATKSNGPGANELAGLSYITLKLLFATEVCGVTSSC